MWTQPTPSAVRRSIYGPEPKERAAALPGMVGLEIRRLFPDVPQAIYVEGDDLSAVREATRNALRDVRMDRIRPGDAVNILASQYGFTLMGGQASAEMLKTIKDVVEERTGCTRIRLRVCTGFRRS